MFPFSQSQTTNDYYISNYFWLRQRNNIELRQISIIFFLLFYIINVPTVKEHRTPEPSN
jgi:hypothetical protein